MLGQISAMDQTTVNLDQDPEFWPKLDPDPDPGLSFRFK